MKHTKGPYYSKPINSYLHQIRAKDPKNHAYEVVVAECGRWGTDPESTKANAELMAAAPELLQACKAAVISLIGDETFSEYKDLIDTLQAAIQKAGG